MTEKSFLWTTGGAGDGASTYTRADWAEIARIFATCHDNEGVAPNYLNRLEGTVPGANTVRINSGAALVDGKPYMSDASVDVNIPSAVGGGNTRIDRIVLRADWTAQTVRITRIAGTDAASPTPPALTQIPGTTYDIPLYQAQVTTAGTVTLTDERLFGQVQGFIGIAAGSITATPIANGAVSAAKIADGAVTEAKIGNNAVTNAKIADGSVTLSKLANPSVDSNKIFDGAVGPGKLANGAVIAGKLANGAVDTTARLANDIVDDTKVGNRVPQFYRRKGGSATDWNEPGSTTYTPGAVRMQAGADTIMPGAITDPFAVKDVTFPVAFGAKPGVQVTFEPHASQKFIYYADNFTTTGFSVWIVPIDGQIGFTNAVRFHWLAYGTE